MGRDKLLLDAGDGLALVVRQQRLLLELGLPTFLLAGPDRCPPRLAGVARLHDPEPSAGPLTALRAAHARLGGELFVVAADQPGLEVDALQELLRRAGGAPSAPAVIASREGRPQPFPGLYRPAFFAGLSPGQRSILDALRATGGVADAGLDDATIHDWDRPQDRAGQGAP